MYEEEDQGQPGVIHYVTGFIYDERHKFLLVRKTTGPECLHGKLNGIGGKIEQSDFFPTSAIDREVKEEAGLEGLDWHTTGMVVGEGDFVNIIFHTKVPSLEKLDFAKVNDNGEKHGIYTLADIIQGEPSALGVPQIMSHLIFGNPETDKIEITRYNHDLNEILFNDDDAII